MTWQEQLRQELAGCSRLAVLGAGSILCGDDAAGMLLIERLRELLPPDGSSLLLAGSTAPENFTGPIRDYRPDLLLLADAAHLDLPVGAIGFIPADAVDEAGFSTHMLPLGVTLNYLAAETGCRVLIVGVQPGATEFASDPCPAVLAAVEELAQAIAVIWGGCG